MRFAGSADRPLARGAIAAAVTVLVIGAVLAGTTRPWEPAPSASPSPVAASPSPSAGCPAVAELTHSVARRWDDALLDAIRRALPNPPVHARNLFHLSVAMWDAWAAYDDTASGYLFKEKRHAGECELAAARREAISYAAFRVLSARFIKSVGADVSLSEFANLMDEFAFPVTITTTEGNTPAAVGNRIAKAVLAYGLADGSNEAGGYANPSYKPVNPSLIVALPGIRLVDPNRWQPLEVNYQVSQNGVPIPGNEQTAVGTQWGHVTPFAIPAGGAQGMPIDPGRQPLFGDPAGDALYRAGAVEVIRDSSLLDRTGDTSMDVSPASLGANALGSNSGHGHPVNPATGLPYASDVVYTGDFYRALAEFWADGPNSETPPGHWNVIANAVSDLLAPDLRIGGKGPQVERLEWDVKLYLALNGAVHDAAIAAWGIKGRYDSVRPISMIRYMASLGQSSDPRLPSYDKEGLPLVPGLIELVTKELTREGAPMQDLSGHEGEVAVYAWRPGSVGWMLGVTWVPYQAVTFVTPAFPGYVSGHSTFSRAAAEVMTAFTGNEYFPGGLSEWTVSKGLLRTDIGPRFDVVLQWATYYDAADQAGQSRLFGGIHVQADDFAGRIVGSTCGKDAWIAAQRYYAGR
jgi:hypothetical protein